MYRFIGLSICTVLALESGFSASALGSDSSICANQESFLRSVTAQDATVEKLILAIRDVGPTVISIGETHFESEEITDYYYPAFLKSLKTELPSLDCVAVEMDEASNKLLFNQILSDPSLPTDSAVFHYRWEYLLRQGVQMEMKIFAIDSSLPPTTDMGDSYLLRNRQMSSRLKNLLDGGQCHKILTVNGMLHLWDEARPSITSLMKAAGYSSFKIGLIDLTEIKGFLDKGWLQGGLVWRDSTNTPICSSLPGALNENHAAIISELGSVAKVPILSSFMAAIEVKGAGRWSDFDGVIAVGCPRTVAAHCSSLSKLQDRGYLNLTR